MAVGGNAIRGTRVGSGPTLSSASDTSWPTTQPATKLMSSFRAPWPYLSAAAESSAEAFGSELAGVKQDTNW